MDKSIMNELDAANRRLRDGRIGIALEVRGKQNWLYLRGTFPPKPGSRMTIPHQQRIALKMKATPQAIKQAEGIAKLIGAELNLGQFSWHKWSDAPDPTIPRRASEVVAEAEEVFWRDRERNQASETTWKNGYRSCYRQLPDEPLTIDLLLDWIRDNSRPDSGRRRQYITAGRLLCNVAELPTGELDRLRGKFSQKPINPRSLPSDAEIVAARELIKKPGWRYFYGLMAAYGLRNHEVFGLDVSEFPLARVRDNTKTGSRAIVPLFPEWAEAWDLGNPILPNIETEGLSNEQLGSKLTKFFIRNECPFSPYNLRHCYARRCVEFGILTAEAAKLMGHSPQVHELVYRAWVGEKVYLDRVRAATGRSDRPLPP